MRQFVAKTLGEEEEEEAQDHADQPLQSQPRAAGGDAGMAPTRTDAHTTDVLPRDAYMGSFAPYGTMQFGGDVHVPPQASMHQTQFASQWSP